MRSVFLLFKIHGRLIKPTRYLDRFSIHPAQTILLSFLLVILTGSLLLMMGFTTADGRGLSFIDALFTATSAVCVTGLIVVDTATHYTLWGQVVILALIQIGGLGIMILSFFAIFTLRKRVSLEDKLLLSYMLSEEDMSSLTKTLSSIVLTTLVIEAGGAFFLFIGFSSTAGAGWKTAFFSIFHAVSAFCNAGFALYSDSLEGFRSDPFILGVVALLILLGGMGFSTLTNFRGVLGYGMKRITKGKRHRGPFLTLNSRLVLKYTGRLLLTGLCLVYLLEHAHTMKSYRLGEQYLSAFFQSVTLRTAGFNSIPFGGLRDATYLVMILFMFIGAASGSTAGGIKVNSLAVITSSIASYLKNRKNVVIQNHTLPSEVVSKAYLILLFGIGIVFLATLSLTLTERKPFLQLLFEAVSAFGTVGLSAGVTPRLTPLGKLTITLLMYLGRLGPLTILSAARSNREPVPISFPQADISIG